MNCTHCGKPIVLIPSATARAKKCGGKVADYTKLFEYHAECTLKMREESTRELMTRIKLSA